MDIDQATELVQAMDIIEARELLVQLKVADFPNLSKDERKKLHRSFYKTAFPNVEKKPMSTGDVARILARG